VTNLPPSEGVRISPAAENPPGDRGQASAEPALKVENVPQVSFGDPLEVSEKLPRRVNVPSEAVGNPLLVSDKLSDRERVAVWFAWVLLGLIALICATLLWEHHHIQLPQAASGSDEKTAIENYKALSALIDERTEKFFDLFVTKALLPVFTTLIGFLLGRRSKED